MSFCVKKEKEKKSVYYQITTRLYYIKGPLVVNFDIN